MFLRFSLLVTVVSVITVSGCMDSSFDGAWSDPRPLGRDFGTFQAPRDPPATIQCAREIAESNGVITLRQALALALMYNPELRAFSWEVRASEARTLQAGLLPNPEIEVEVEEVGGTGEKSGFEGVETTVSLGQTIELAGKRSKRKHVASVESELAGWDYEAARLDILTQTSHAFVGVLAAQERLILAEELVRLSEQLLNTVKLRVEAGKDPPVEETKAQVALANARIEEKQARQSLASARAQLAATWGGTSAIFERAAGQLDAISPIPPEAELRRLLAQNPDAARWSSEVQMRRAALELEKANAITDPTIFGGMQRFNDGDDTAVTFGLSIPVPVFNRNQGRILEAKYEVSKAQNQQKAAEASLSAALAKAYQGLASAFIGVTDLKNEVLPGAESAFDAARRGYSEGKFNYLMVLDAQRTLFQARARYIKALETYHQAKVDVERLIGQEINTIRIGQR